MNDSRAAQIKMTDPQEPDTLARIAGKDMYGSSVGALRRVELFRLGNAWGMNFPTGASKDYMLPFFKQLEAEGKNPMRPPGMAINNTGDLRGREVRFSDQNHTEALLVEPNPKTDFEEKLERLPHSQLKKICKLRGIPQTAKDRKLDLIARIVAASEGNTNLDQDAP